MIKLSKQKEPKVLTDNFLIWTRNLLEKLRDGIPVTSTDINRYRHKDIKAALELETGGKCAYCESKLKHIHHGDVEHIYPKSLDPSKQFFWENLTLACEICNQNKSNKDPYINNILDPYVDNPEKDIFFVGPFAGAFGSAKGVSTIALLELNRASLIEMRGEAVVKIMKIIDTIMRPDIPLPAKRALFKDLEENEAGDSSQYAGMIRNILFSMKSKLPVEIFN